MNIGQMFAKSINREIKPVVKPGQVDDALAQILIVSVSGFPASLEVVNLTF